MSADLRAERRAPWYAVIPELPCPACMMQLTSIAGGAARLPLLAQQRRSGQSLQSACARRARTHTYTHTRAYLCLSHPLLQLSSPLLPVSVEPPQLRQPVAQARQPRALSGRLLQGQSMAGHGIAQPATVYRLKTLIARHLACSRLQQPQLASEHTYASLTSAASQHALPCVPLPPPFTPLRFNARQPFCPGPQPASPAVQHPLQPSS